MILCLLLFLSPNLWASASQVEAPELCHGSYRTLVATSWDFGSADLAARMSPAAARELLAKKAFGEHALKTKEREQWLKDHEIVRVLGQGTFGVTLLVRDKRYHKLSVIKTTLNPGMATTLVREAGLAADAAEAGVGPASRITWIGGTPVMEMEYVEGSASLKSVARDAPEDRVAQLLSSAARQLDKLHDRGILHLDLKGDNLLVAGDEVKIIDFGMSEYNHPELVGQPGMGTMNYIGPHQLKGKPRASDDWFSFAMIVDQTFGERFTGPKQIYQRAVPGTDKHQRWTRPYGLQPNPPKYLSERPQLRQFLQLARNVGGFRPEIEPPKMTPLENLTMGRLFELAAKPKATAAERAEFERGYTHMLKQLSPEAQFLVVFGEPSLSNDTALAKLNDAGMLKPMLAAGYALADKERVGRNYRLQGDAPSLVDIDYRRAQSVLADKKWGIERRLEDPLFALAP